MDFKNKEKALDQLEAETPEVINLIKQLAELSTKNNVLDAKTKALLTLLWAIQSNQQDCIEHHVQNAIIHQVDKNEIKELVSIAAYMGGGPGMMVAQKALELFEHLQSK